MKYKLIATDFDGTLLTDNKKITIETKNTLKNIKNEYIIVGATARNLGSVKSVCDINIFHYLILNNGACIYDVCNDKVIYENYLDFKIVEKISEKFKTIASEIDYCCLNKYYKKKKESKFDSKDFIDNINNTDEVKEKVMRMNIFFDEYSDIEKYKKLIDDEYDGLNTFVMQDSNDVLKWLVVNPSETSKKTSLKRLGEYLNIGLDNMVYFGDGPNDIETISSVGCGVAMENALLEVKKIAKNITLSNNDNGVAEFIKNLKK